MNRYQKEVELQLVRDEEDCRERLKANYRVALKDVRGKLREMAKDPGSREKMGQVRYQLMLDAQIETVLNRLGEKNVTDLTGYLGTMYRDGYLGCLYGMNREGVGMVLRLDEEKIKAVVNMDVKGLKFSGRLYNNLDRLKMNFRTELARGFSTGSDYLTMAANLALYGDADLKQSYRIIKTEGHRVQSQAKMAAMQEAKKIGADVVKQWDSTVDSSTRASHRELDGQVRELDEKFVSPVTGAAAMYPGGFGIASEDINCRCALLQRARWADTGGGHKYSRLEQEIISMEAASYREWKHEYRKLLKAPEIKDPVFSAAQVSLQELLAKSGGSPRHVGLMRMYSECTEYREDLTMDGAAAYSIGKDAIIYNPGHPSFGEIDLATVQAHELSHRMDIIEYGSYNDSGMLAAFTGSREYALNHMAELQEIFDGNGDYFNDPMLSDVLMTLTKNKLSLPYCHEVTAIDADSDAVLEIFADISAMDVLDNGNIAVLEGNFPELMAAYKRIVGWTN